MASDSPTQPEDAFDAARRQMVDLQLRARDIRDPRVLRAMGRVPRHRFVPESESDLAYADQALPLSLDQTISQPYIVALMSQLANVPESGVALDVGTGSGYQAAVLAELCRQVYSIEVRPALARSARQRLRVLGYDNVEVVTGDGLQGLAEHAPYDAIIAAAAPRKVPPALVEQLARGGRLVLPLGRHRQMLTVVEKDLAGAARQHSVASVAFVPMVDARPPDEDGRRDAEGP